MYTGCTTKVYTCQASMEPISRGVAKNYWINGNRGIGSCAVVLLLQSQGQLAGVRYVLLILGESGAKYRKRSFFRFGVLHQLIGCHTSTSHNVLHHRFEHP